VFSVDTEEEAKRLVILCCSKNLDTGTYYSREMAMKQDLDQFQVFSEKLQRGQWHLNKAKANG